MNQISVVFLGTHTFATTILQALIDDPDISVDLVITQPDKSIGRNKELTSSPVKILAQANGLTIDQPTSLHGYSMDPHHVDLGISAQYGQLIPESVLQYPSHGIINVHTSLLPKYRGASPIQSALIHGEHQTGVTIMKLDKGLDTGPILSQISTDIFPDETYPELETRLAPLATSVLLPTIREYVSGTLKPQAQDNTKATFCKQLSRDDGRIQWNSPASSIYNQYRGLTPWPGIWTKWNDKRLKLLSIIPSKKTHSPGKVFIENDTLYIGCSEGSVEVITLQLEGKNSMTAKNFINGFRDCNTIVLH